MLDGWEAEEGGEVVGGEGAEEVVATLIWVTDRSQQTEPFRLNQRQLVKGIQIDE